jgi:hypothetical protein
MQINGVEIEGKDVATHGLRGPHISVDDNWYAYWSITEFVWGGGGMCCNGGISELV